MYLQGLKQAALAGQKIKTNYFFQYYRTASAPFAGRASAGSSGSVSADKTMVAIAPRLDETATLHGTATLTSCFCGTAYAHGCAALRLVRARAQLVGMGFAQDNIIYAN